MLTASVSSAIDSDVSGVSTSMPVTYRAYQSGDEYSIMEGFNTAFGLARDVDYWRWKFASDGEPLVMLAVDAEDVVQCHMAAIRTEWQGIDFVIPIVQVGDVFTRRTPEVIRHKVMLKTFVAFHKNHARSDDIKLLFGFPNKRLAALHNTQSPLSESGKPIVTWRRSNAELPQIPVPECVTHTWPDIEAADTLWQQAAVRYRLCSPRDHAWLTRRFQQRPDVDDYHFLGVTRSDGTLATWAVVRPVGDTLWVCDLLWNGRQEIELCYLDAAVLACARQMGLTGCGLWLQGDSAAVEVLTAQGWKNHTHEQFIELALHLYDDSLDAGWIYANLYLTHADSDLI